MGLRRHSDNPLCQPSQNLPVHPTHPQISAGMMLPSGHSDQVDLVCLSDEQRVHVGQHPRLVVPILPASPLLPHFCCLLCPGRGGGGKLHHSAFGHMNGHQHRQRRCSAHTLGIQNWGMAPSTDPRPNPVQGESRCWVWSTRHNLGALTQLLAPRPSQEDSHVF